MIDLNKNHYLGASGKREVLRYEHKGGLMIFSRPTSRRIPKTWLELSRWCIISGKGSEQWKGALQYLRDKAPGVTTVISYSDPSVGHDGALYRACNWIWAPVWHQLRPPPTGAGVRSGRVHAAKSRWVYLLEPDCDRGEILRLKDKSLARKFPWVGYTEPRWRRGKPVVTPEMMQRHKMWTNRETK